LLYSKGTLSPLRASALMCLTSSTLCRGSSIWRTAWPPACSIHPHRIHPRGCTCYLCTPLYVTNLTDLLLQGSSSKLYVHLVCPSFM
jgi:hypothetical protein